MAEQDKQSKDKKIIVDAEVCIGCGACENTAPDYFQLNKDGISKVKKQYNEKDEDVIKSAIEGCPVDAISIQ